MKDFKITLVGLLLLVVACTGKGKKTLPILGNRQVVEKTINGETVIDTVFQKVPAFTFVNQDSSLITDKDFDGKIYVVDFFFTSCPSICPVMHRNMLEVYKKFKGNSEVKLVSHTIDYKYDTPEVLKKYANKLGVDGHQWEFLRGTRDSVYTFAEKHYLTAVGEDSGADGGYIHEGWFVLVDKEKRLRGAYDGTKEDQVELLMDDMEILLAEYKENEK